MRTGAFRYNKAIDRWYFENELFDYHCGEIVEFKIGNRYVPGRLEYEREWYVIFPDVRFRLMPGQTYQVRV